MRQLDVWVWLTAPMAVLLAIAAGSGVVVEGIYRDAPSFAAQARGQDYVSLFVVLPTLAISAFFALRSAPRARMVWLGALVYLVYSYAIAAFDVRFNPLFLVYVALFGCSLYALIGGLVMTDLQGIKASFPEKTPVRAVSVYLAVLAVLFYFLWLSDVIPALLSGKVPQSIIEDGTPTNAVHVLDMAWILPALGITAAGLRQRKAFAYTLAGAILTFIALLTLAILSMVLFMIREGRPVIALQVAIFVALFAVSLGMLIRYLKCVQSPR